MKSQKLSLLFGLCMTAQAVSAAPVSADLMTDCGATDLKSYFENTPRDDAAKIGGGLAYTFDAGELACLERVPNGINPTHYEDAEAGASYVKLQFKLVSFEERMTQDQLRISLAKFIRRLFYRKGKTNSLDVEVKAGDTVIGIENIFSVSYDDREKMTDYSAVAQFEAGISPWVSVSERENIKFALKGHAANTPKLTAMSTLVESAKQLAGLQASPTRVLSKLTEARFQSFALDVESKINAQLIEEQDTSLGIEIRSLGGPNDPAGMYFELVNLPDECVVDMNSRACRRKLPSGPIKPLAGVIIYPIYRNSMLTSPEQKLPGTNIPHITEEAAKIRALRLGPLGIDGWSTLSDYLKNSQESLYNALKDRTSSVEDFEPNCEILANFVANDTGLQRYDRAAAIWAFLQTSPFYSRADARYRSRCPEKAALDVIKELKLEEPELGSLITEADVERGVKVVEDAIYDLASARGSVADRRRRAADRFNPRVKSIKIMDREGIIANGPIDDTSEVIVPLRHAVNEYLDRIARAYPQTCSSTLRQIQIARGEQAVDGLNIGFILLASAGDDTEKRYANMSIDLRSSTIDIPVVSISPISKEEIIATRDEYPGCDKENFPLPDDTTENAQEEEGGDGQPGE